MKKSILLLITVQSYLLANATANRCSDIRHCKENPDNSFLMTTLNDSLALNSPAPAFNLCDLTGKWYSLKDLKGKIVVLNFWFIACKPCVNEMPVLNKIKNKYNPGNVVFLALSLDHKQAIEAFLKKNRFEYNILPDANGTAEKYKINAYPASLVIDHKGIIRFVQIGGPNIDQNLTNAIKGALVGKY